MTFFYIHVMMITVDTFISKLFRKEGVIYEIKRGD